MDITTSLLDFVKDDFTPEIKKPPQRITKTVLLDCELQQCPLCGEDLYIYYTNKRKVITILYDLQLKVRYKHCVNPGCLACQQSISFHNPELERTVLPNHRYAFDITLLIGHLIAKEHMTEHGVVDYLLEEHGIVITQPGVNHYKRIALAISEAMMLSNTSKVKKKVAALPLRVFVIDGTSSNRSKTLFIIRELLTGTVLGAAILTEHDKDAIHAFLEGVFTQFGRPDYLVGDGERGLIGAIREYYSDIPYQYCQTHFLKNMGKALMEDLVKPLNKGLKKTCAE